MNAVLLYLATGHIEFAPLSSLLLTRNQEDGPARQTLLDEHVSEHPTLPPPVSPKSVYRLAHLLHREELQQLALDALSMSLATEARRANLFGPVSIVCADFKKVELNYVVENWQEVQASKSWNEMREKATTGEIEGAAQILFDLLSTLQEKDLIRATPKKQT